MNRLLLFGRYTANLKHTLERFSLKLSIQGSVLNDELYLCPIGMTFHTVDDLNSGSLTIEHVPQKSLGGKPLILTSKEVNNRDGHMSDINLLQYFQSKNFLHNGGKMGVKIT